LAQRNQLLFFSLAQRNQLLFFSLAQRKETKENIGYKLLAKNSALRLATQ